MVNELLGEGVKPNVANNDGKTALWYANDKNHTDIVTILTQAGAK